MKKFAVFDIDGTLFRSSLAIEFLDALIEEGYFPASSLKKYIKAYEDWINRKASFEAYIHEFTVIMDERVAGIHKKDLLRISKQVASFHKNRVYRYTRDLLKDLQDRGYFTIAISFSSQMIVDEFCKKWKFDEVCGAPLLFDKNNRCLPRENYGFDWDKERILKEIVAKNKLSFKGSVGVGDTRADIAFLKLVQKPICFNPNIKLYEYAKENNWPIVVERKDVIYKL